MGKLNKINIDKTMQKAITAHQNDDFKKAEELYKKVLQVDPNHPDANHNFGVLCVQHNQHKLAIPFFEKAVKANPENKQYQQSLANIHSLSTENQAITQQLTTLFNQQKYSEALTLAKEVVKKDHNNTFAWKVMGSISFLIKDYKNAILYLNQAITLDPNDASSYNSLGSTLKNIGQSKEAEAQYQKAITLDPDFAEAYNNLGILLKDTNRLEEAEVQYKKVITLKPNFAEVYYSLGNLFKDTKRLKEAEAYYQKAIDLKPNYLEAYIDLGNLLKDAKRLEEAEIQYKKVIDLKPDFAEIYYNLGNLLKQANRLEEAEAFYQKAIALKPDYIEAYSNLGNLLKQVNRLEEAELQYQKVIALKPDFAEVYYNLGNLLKQANRLEETEAYYQKAITLKHDYVEAHLGMSAILKYRSDTPHLQQIQEVYNKVTNDTDRYHLGYVLAKAYEDMKEYDQSFYYLEEANRLKFKESAYSIKKSETSFTYIKKLFSDSKIIHPKQDQQISKKRPIFIVGMPRSGTSLTEQILSSHLDVYGCGELEFLREALNKHSKYSQKTFVTSETLDNFYKDYMEQIEKQFQFNEPVFTDKMPMNFRYIGAILEAFPNAKIIHTKRDAIAICWSIYKTHFPARGMNYSNSFETIAKYYQLYEEMMQFWEKRYPKTIYTLEYEKLTENQEEETKKLLEFCELSWDEAVLRPEENKRAVKTASNQQVRKKVYKGSSQSWKKYEKHLQPLIEQLNNKA